MYMTELQLTSLLIFYNDQWSIIEAIGIHSWIGLILQNSEKETLRPFHNKILSDADVHTLSNWTQWREMYPKCSETNVVNTKSCSGQ